MAKSNEKKKKKTSWQQYLGIIFMILIGIFCGIIMALYIDKSSADTTAFQEIISFAVLFISLYAALLFHIIIHEAGHLVFGLMTGYKFSSFRIASFMWLKESGKIKLKRVSIAGTAGQCLMAPPDMKAGRLPIVLYNLGGSFFNLITGILFLSLFLFITDIPLLSPILLIFAIIGFMTAMINGIPMRMGTVDNDGYNAFSLSKNKEAVEAFWMQLKVVEQTSKGIRLKDMPAEWFDIPTDDSMKNSMVATRCVFACNRLMDEEKFEEADALMAHLLEIESGIVGLHHDLLICDRIYVELIRENRSDIIEGMLTKEQKQFMKAMKRFPSVLRTQYALALLWEKDVSRAETIKHDFEKAVKSYPYPHEIEAERDLMLIAERVCKS